MPNNTDYEIAGAYSIEYYTDPVEYKAGSQDEKYYCEIWVPVKTKQ